jgi:hypothetical protein
MQYLFRKNDNKANSKILNLKPLEARRRAGKMGYG